MLLPLNVLCSIAVLFPQQFLYFINILQEEDLYKAFANDNPELGVEAIRVPRDPQTSISKGFAFVLFKTKVRVLWTCLTGTLVYPELGTYTQF